jgi:transcriptional regulator with XRE-family HTH domain
MPSKKTPREILRTHRKAKKLSQDEVAKLLGLKDQQNVQKWESEKAMKRIPPKHYPALIRLLEIPPHEFLKATPEPAYTDALRACVAEGIVGEPRGMYRRESSTPMAATMIPIVGFVAGDPDSDIAWEPMDPPRTTHFAGCSAVEVQGDSMDPVARPGQLVVYHPEIEAADGDLALIRLTSGKNLFKRVYWDDGDPNVLCCVSIKPGLRERRIPSEEVEAVWKVIGVKFA